MMQTILRRPLILAATSGILLALSWPARGLAPLAFLAFIPMFVMEEWFFQRREKHAPITFFAYIYIGFLLFNGLTTWWIARATLPGAILAVMLNSGFMALPWWAMHKSRRILPGRQGPTSLIVFWLAFEWLHSQWELSWSWLDLGNVFANLPSWIQWYEYTGTAGGTLWVLAVNLLLFYALKQHFLSNRSIKAVRAYLLLALAFLLFPLASSWVMWTNHQETSNPIEVVVVQPSEDPYQAIASSTMALDRIEYMIELANQAIGPNTRFVVAPEAVNPLGIWMHEDEIHPVIQRLRNHMETHPNLSWVLGSFTHRRYEPGESRPASARLHSSGNYHYDTFNSAILVEKEGPVIFHHKSMLVPGIERMPYHRWLKPIGGIVDRMGGMSGSLGTSDQPSAFITSDNLGIVPSVCYESIYGDYMSTFVRQGGEVFFIITNDGWWGETPGHRQHNQYARLRAVESRRSIARAASTGISSFINQRGEVLAEISWAESSAMAMTIHTNDQLTFFSKTGNYLGKWSVFLAALLVLHMISQLMMGAKNRPTSPPR